MTLFVAAFAMAGATLGYTWPHLREHLRARRARQGLGRARYELDATLDDEVVTLCGVLRGDGSGPVAATTARYPGDPLATMLRAERLHVVVGEDPVELEGGVDVVVGSEEVPSRLKSELALATSSWATRRMLRTGDSVVVRGCLRADAGDFSGYRLSNTKWTMLPEGLCRPGGSDAIAVVNGKAPRCYGARLPLVVAGAIVGGLLFPIGHGIAGLTRLPSAQAKAPSLIVAADIDSVEAKPARASRTPLSRHSLGPLTAGTRSDINVLRKVWAGYHVGEVPWPPHINGRGYERYVVADNDGHRILMLEAGLSVIRRAEIYDTAVITERGMGVGSRVADLFAVYPDATCRRDLWRSVAPDYGDQAPLREVVVCWAASSPRLEFAVSAEFAAVEAELGEIVPRESIDEEARVLRISYRFE